MSRPWIVLKFGGTSVASAASWSTIADRARALLPGHRVWIVASALAGVTDLLETAIAEALDATEGDAVARLRERHRELAVEIGLDPRAAASVDQLIDELERRLEGVRLTGEVSPRLRARLMSTGELASTHLGAAALVRHGLSAGWVDARDLLTSRRRDREAESDPFERWDASFHSMLSASSTVTPNLPFSGHGSAGATGRTRRYQPKQGPRVRNA